MSYPHRICLPVYPLDYHIEVELQKDICLSEPPHCYVNYFNKRCAKVLLKDCSIATLYCTINPYDLDRILNTISNNLDELKEVYEHNSKYGF